jgi:7-cyano-7-deazaguanine synthase in queuosine biosynthesis
MPERYVYDIDENGLVRKQADDSRPDSLGQIVTARETLPQFAPFDSLERDLVRIAVAVLNVDRRSLRQRPGVREEAREASRLRSLAVRIPMENPARWHRAIPVLTELLRFMTDDRWEFEFTQAEYVPAEQMPLFPESVADGTELVLFSGGLDSVAGLWATHRIRPRPFVAVTVYGDTVKLSSREVGIQTLQNLGANIELVCFKQQFRRALASRDGNGAESNPQRIQKTEESQRTRGFVFFSIAAAMASALRLPAVTTYEAGVGALNVPANEAQIGAQNTRAMHPWTLDRLEHLFLEVLDHSPRVNAPFLFHTKGEVCRQAGTEIERLARVATSCDEGEGHKTNSMEHCGVCTSCLLRRAAIYSALGAGDPTPYRDNATGTHGDYDVRAFATQTATFREASVAYVKLLQVDPEIRRAARYHIGRGLSQQEVEEGVRALFSRHAAEASRFLESPQCPVLPLPRSIAKARS